MSRAKRTNGQAGPLAGGPGRGGEGAGVRRRAATAENATAEEQCHPRKIFVGGLAHKTTTQQLRDHFQAFGPVVDAVVLRWPDGRSRGFGYVTFAEANPASSALRAQPHRIGGRQVDVKRAVPGTNKLFVGGLPQHSTAAELRAHFETFGVVSDAVVMIDPATGRSRGFGFVCFLPGQEGSEAVAASLAEYQNHRLRGKWIEVKSAAPPHKLAAGKEAQSEEERLLAAARPPSMSPLPSGSPASSLEPTPRSTGGRPVATPHRQAARSGDHEPLKVSLPSPSASPGLGQPGAGSASSLDFGLPPGFGAGCGHNDAEACGHSAASGSATIPGMTTPPPLVWGPPGWSLASALLAQQAAAAAALAAQPPTATVPAWSESPRKVQPSSGLCSPEVWEQEVAPPPAAAGLAPAAVPGVAAPLLGRAFGGSEFGTSLQKSLEELFRTQCIKFAEGPQAAAPFAATAGTYER